jgi:hypothetical protein
MPNYQNGKIYKLVSFQTDKIYIGSTTQNLAMRKAGHQRDYINYLNKKKNYISSFELVKLGDVDIVLLESFPCNNKEELHKKERYYIENTMNCINRVIPTRTIKEYYIDNIEKIKEYYKENCEKKKAYSKQYKVINKEKVNKQKNVKHVCNICNGKYITSNKSFHIKTEKHIKALNN